jgi:acetolactate synthase-1/3 small subunit
VGVRALRYTLAALVENRAGVLARVAGLISRRGFNIERLAVGPAERAPLAPLTIGLAGGAGRREQMVRQLGKLVGVLAVRAPEDEGLAARELALCGVRWPADARPAPLQMAGVWGARVVDVDGGSLTLEVTGGADKASAMIGPMAEYGVAEAARTGRAALARGGQTLAEPGTEVR